jgi:hypothetical protein
MKINHLFSLNKVYNSDAIKKTLKLDKIMEEKKNSDVELKELLKKINIF